MNLRRHLLEVQPARALGTGRAAARQHFAAQKADGRIPKGHAQRADLEMKQQSYEQDFNSTVLSLFDKVLFPIQRAGRAVQLASKPLDTTRDSTKPFSGEEQIEKTLTSNPLKLYLDVEKEFDAIRDKAQDLLWPENQDEARWSDVVDRCAEQAGRDLNSEAAPRRWNYSTHARFLVKPRPVVAVRSARPTVAALQWIIP